MSNELAPTSRTARAARAASVVGARARRSGSRNARDGADGQSSDEAREPARRRSCSRSVTRPGSSAHRHKSLPHCRTLSRGSASRMAMCIRPRRNRAPPGRFGYSRWSLHMVRPTSRRSILGPIGRLAEQPAKPAPSSLPSGRPDSRPASPAPSRSPTVPSRLRIERRPWPP